jgi:hypothetical protein
MQLVGQAYAPGYPFSTIVIINDLTGKRQIAQRCKNEKSF